ELEFRLKAGDPARVEEYSQRFPDLAADDGIVADLVQAEIEFRRRLEPGLDLAEYRKRIPGQWETIQRALEPSTGPYDGPEPAPLQVEIPGYEVLKVIGRGGMGVVYRVRDKSLERDLAVKVLRAKFRGHLEMRHRFVAEAKVMAKLPHPGVPPVHEFGELDDGSPFLVMKLVKGRTLHDQLEERPTPAHDRPRLLGIFAKVCETVGYAHYKGV